MSSTEAKATKTNTIPPALLTVAEAAAELRCSITTMYREITEGHIAFHKVRGKRLIHRDDLDAYIEKSRMVTTPLTEIPTYTATKRRLSAEALELIGDDEFEVKPRAHKRAK